MEHLKEELDLIITFLKPYLPLANSHTVDFIVNDLWPRVISDDVRLEVDSNQVQNVLNNFWLHGGERSCQINRFLDEAKKYTLEDTNFCVNRGQLDFRSERTENTVKITEFMSNKKLHEVECMSQFVADVAAMSKCSLIMDIGSGKGYLTSVLALQYGIKILGMDCNQININGAKKTTMKLEVFSRYACA